VAKVDAVTGRGPKEKIDSPLIERRDGKIIIVADKLQAADEVLHKQMKYEEEVVVSSMKIGEALPWDGAIALQVVLERRWGAALMAAGGGEPMVEVGVGEQRAVQWGRYYIPGADKMGGEANFMQCDVERLSDGRIVFKLVAKIQRKWDEEFREIVKLCQEYVRDHSIYRGKAIRVKLLDGQRQKLSMPDIKFMDVSQASLEDIIFNRDVEAVFEDNVITPLRHRAQCEKLGAPRRRGVLLWGKPGVGKTMAAAAIAKVATEEAKMTYILGEASEFEHLMALALQLQGEEGVVLFAEDIDRIVAGAKRTAEIDRILNIVDGVNTKGARVFIVLTTNDLSAIRDEMLREGRLDVTLHLPAPDAEAVERLLRRYGRQQIAPEADLSEAGRVLAGTVPATVREVIERAKFSFIRRTGGKTAVVKLDGEDVLRAAWSVMQQRKDIERSRVPAQQHPYIEGAKELARAIRYGVDGGELMDDIGRYAGSYRPGSAGVEHASEEIEEFDEDDE
jgi:transitional endoplasmic reticulum ATPase